MTEQDVERIVAMVMDLTLGNASPEMVRGRVVAGHAAKHLAAMPNRHEKALAVAREALEWCASDSTHYYQMYGDLRPQNASEMQLRAKQALSTIDEIVGK